MGMEMVAIQLTETCKTTKLVTKIKVDTNPKDEAQLMQRQRFKLT